MFGGVSCVIPLGIPVASTGHARGVAFSFGRNGGKAEEGNERNCSNEEKRKVFDCRGAVLYRAWLVGRAGDALLLLQVLRAQDDVGE